MNIQASLQWLRQRSAHLMPLLLSGMIVPLLVLAAIGVYAIYSSYSWQYSTLFIVTGMTLCSVLMRAIVWLLARRKAHDAAPVDDQTMVLASQDWGVFDQQVWQRLKAKIPEQLAQDSDWQTMEQHALELVTLCAAEYGRREWDFSIPEALCMAEEVSRRYRRVLKAHIPGVESIQIGHIKLWYQHKDEATEAWVWSNRAYRVLRLANPLAAVVAEMKSAIQDQVLQRVSKEIQTALKTALLHDVLAVSIDLYSGRFKITDDELAAIPQKQSDDASTVPLQPLRLCLVGQPSAGKSSIINALQQTFIAEVDCLPATDAVRVYDCSIDGTSALSLVDVPGLDGSTTANTLSLREVVNSDVILWVLKANQPARALDVALKAQIDDYYQQATHRSRKRPVMIGVLNQVDRLPPTQSWQPPYDLNDLSCAKAAAIHDALSYNQSLLSLTTIIPLCVAEDREHFNVPALLQQIDQCYNDGIQTQLNRRRNEANRFNPLDQVNRIGTTVSSLFKLYR
jgi:hypothetical protein